MPRAREATYPAYVDDAAVAVAWMLKGTRASTAIGGARLEQTANESNPMPKRRWKLRL